MIKKIISRKHIDEYVKNNLPTTLRNFYETGLFSLQSHEMLRLGETEFLLGLSFQRELVWLDSGSLIFPTTDEVLMSLPEDLQIKLLFHLDLLRDIRE